MRVLLSTIGSRGEVQPLLALALELRALGQEVRVCVPPDFREWIEGHGVRAFTIGPTLRPPPTAGAPAGREVFTPARLRQLAHETVAAQFATVAEAARGCDVLLACGALQLAARSIAETQRIRYVYASYCPATLPSPHHAPPPVELRGDAPAPESSDCRALWAADAQRWNDTFGAVLNAHRAATGLPPVADVRSHVFTERPWLAADPALGPWPEPADPGVFQTGAWILPDARPLSPGIERFLAAGEPPLYFGFGSMRVAAETGRAVMDAARALGRRAIVQRGWADLAVAGGAGDCLGIDEVNQQALFQRVAAVVHHGGAGTTTAAARAGAPQVVVPQMYDQHYWATRVERLGIGCAHAAGAPAAESLASALRRALEPSVAARAREVAGAVRGDGARVAAGRLVAEGAQPSG